MIHSSGVRLRTNIFLTSSFYHCHDRHYWWSDLSLSVPGPSDTTASGATLQPYEDQAWPLGLALDSYPSWLWQRTATTYISHHLTLCCITAMPIYPFHISRLLKQHPCSFITHFYGGTPAAPHTPIPYTLYIQGVPGGMDKTLEECSLC
jgi:hypothetical protein